MLFYCVLKAVSSSVLFKQYVFRCLVNAQSQGMGPWTIGVCRMELSWELPSMLAPNEGHYDVACNHAANYGAGDGAI